MNFKDRDLVRAALRPGRPHQGTRPVAASLLVLVATVDVCSCVDSGRAGGEVVWSDGTVLAVVTKSELTAAIPMCTSRSGTEAWTDDVRVAIVRTRVGKGPYDEAFLLGSIPDVRAGDRVRLDRQGCIGRKAREADRP